MIFIIYILCHCSYGPLQNEKMKVATFYSRQWLLTLCFFCYRLVEYDAKSQLAVTGNTALIDKLVSMSDLRTGSDYLLFSRQVASNVLCYCTFNPASVPLLVKHGVLEKAIDITRDLLLKDEDVPLT